MKRVFSGSMLRTDEVKPSYLRTQAYLHDTTRTLPGLGDPTFTDTLLDKDNVIGKETGSERHSGFFFFLIKIAPWCIDFNLGTQSKAVSP